MAADPIVSFRDLDAWKVSMDLVVTVYDAASRLPASIPSNVAEGQGYGKEGRNGRYLHHVRIALGSHAEVVTLVELIRRLGLVRLAEFPALEEQLNRTGQLLHGLRRSLLRKQLRSIVSSIALLAGATFLLLLPIL